MIRVLFCLLLLAVAVGCQSSRSAQPGNPYLRDELLDILMDDQQIRAELPTYVRTDGSLDPGFIERMAEVDANNRRRLNDIILAHGWPTISRTGEEGATAAFIIALHIPESDLPFIEDCLEMMSDAAAVGEANPSNLAYLEDRVRMYKDIPQLYGTQFVETDDGLEVYTLYDPENLDQRRASVGLHRSRSTRRWSRRPTSTSPDRTTDRDPGSSGRRTHIE